MLLQKPSKNCQSKDLLKSRERRFEIWKEGNISGLYEEGKAIQDRLKSDESPNSIVKISKKFKLQMQKGNVNGALKILTNNMSGSILLLTDETLQLLEIKHPDAKDTPQQALLQGPIQKMHPIVYDDIDEELIKKSSNKNKRRFGTIRTRCRWVAKDYSFIMFWNSNIRSPQSNCITRQEVMYYKYIKQRRLRIFGKFSCMQVDTS